MSIENKVRQIEHLFDSLEIEITKFKSDSNLHCISGCGKCCTTPYIDASPLEFLPWAFHLFLNHKAEETLNELKKAHSAKKQSRLSVINHHPCLELNSRSTVVFWYHLWLSAQIGSGAWLNFWYLPSSRPMKYAIGMITFLTKPGISGVSNSLR